ncbi:hypothetical protein GCM10020220_085820 [Nonomuraea rubra]
MAETAGRLDMDGPITPECVRAWNNAYVSSRMADSVWFRSSSRRFAAGSGGARCRTSFWSTSKPTPSAPATRVTRR